VGPVIWYGRHWVDNHPQSELLAEYLYTGPWVTGCLLVPQRLNRKKLNAKRQELYEDFLRLGQPVPEEYLPTTMWDEGLLEYRNAFKLAARKVIEERKENSGGEFNPEISVVEGKPVAPRKVGNDRK
jgi:hypothetical protein